MYKNRKNQDKYLNSETIDLRGMRGQGTEKTVLKLANQDNSSQDQGAEVSYSDSIEEKIMHKLSSMTPEEAQSTTIEDHENLQEYKEALHAELDNVENEATDAVYLANTRLKRESLLRELDNEIANADLASFPLNYVNQNTENNSQEQDTEIDSLGENENISPLEPHQEFTQDQDIEQSNIYNTSDEEQSLEYSGNIGRLAHYEEDKPLNQDDFYFNQGLKDDFEEVKKIQENEQQTFDTKLTSFAYGSPIDTGEIANSLKLKRKKSVFKKIVIAIIVILVAAAIFGAGFFGSEFARANNISTQSVQEGYDYLNSGRDSLVSFNSSNAKTYFEQAYTVFEDISGESNFISKGVLSFAELIPFESDVYYSLRILDAGKLYAQSGVQAATALLKAQERDSKPEEIIQHLNSAHEYFNKAKKLIGGIHLGNVPLEFQDEFSNLQKDSDSIDNSLYEINYYLEVVLDILGYFEKRKYLIAFQDDSKLRATGGEIISYGTITLEKGTLKKVSFSDDASYQQKITPPAPLQYSTYGWSVADSNWFFDFPTSARKIQQLSGKNVDGVLFMNPGTIIQFLELTGEVLVPNGDIAVRSDNFIHFVRERNDVLDTIIPIVIDKVLSTEDKMRVIDIFIKGLNEKNIMMYSENENMKSFIKNRRWDGAISSHRDIPNNINDYLAIVVAGVDKAYYDSNIESSVDSTTTIKSDGTVERTVWFSREHLGQEQNKSISNYSYVRFYVPEGSKLIDAGGFEENPEYIFSEHDDWGYKTDEDLYAISKTSEKDENSNTDIFSENDKTVFGNWMNVSLGEGSIVYITYRLPIIFSDDLNYYNLQLQKQPGVSINYSGSIRSEFENHIIDNCELDSLYFPLSRFEFIQEKDSRISCDILHS